MSARLFYLTDLSDHHLMEMIKNDDGNAFDTLYRKYWKPLFNTAYKRLNDRKICEEIIQDLFVHFYQIRAKIDSDVIVGPYLQAALKNRILNHIRSAERRERHSKLAAMKLPLYDTSTDERLAYNSLQMAITKQLEAMPSKYRDIFRLNRQQNFTVKESAEKMGISPSRAEKYLRKALHLLKSALVEFQAIVIILLFLKK